MKNLRICKIDKSKLLSTGAGIYKIAGIKFFKFRNPNDYECTQLNKLEKSYRQRNYFESPSGSRGISKVMNITTYMNTQFYGGAEEGGWYYFHKSVMGTFKALCYKDRGNNWQPVDKRIRAQMNANTGLLGRYQYEGFTSWEIEHEIGENETKETPIYE